MSVSGADMAPLNRDGGKSIVTVILMITDAAMPARSENSNAPDPAVIDIDRMPGGGPDASRMDRRLQTDRLEYLDDVDDRVKRQVVGVDKVRSGVLHAGWHPIVR
ncbi:MAG TPA: hypothetical protein VF926_02460 [Mycobacterium sp.]|jgi:hypothetical protein